MKLITPPAVEPVTLAEAKAQLRITDTAQDALITGLIIVARKDCENELQRSLITQTWEIARDSFPEAIELLRGPLQSVVSVKFDDLNGTEQTLDPITYRVDTYRLTGWLLPDPDYSWPETRRHVNAVRVRYVAGYGLTAADVPEPILQWIKIRIAQLWEHREQVIAGATVAPVPFVGTLLDEYRVPVF
jgi:uncharacterized phiE125 gp8 family phage protein